MLTRAMGFIQYLKKKAVSHLQMYFPAGLTHLASRPGAQTCREQQFSNTQPLDVRIALTQLYTCSKDTDQLHFIYLL